MNRVYAERKAKLDDKKFWEDKNKYEQSWAALRKQKLREIRQVVNILTNQVIFYNKIANSDNSTILDKISAPAAVVDKFIQIQPQDSLEMLQTVMLKRCLKHRLIMIKLEWQAHNKVKEYDRMLQDYKSPTIYVFKLLNDQI